MRVERCVADDMRQAMVKVRQSLGHDALILSNRRVNGQTEIIAAVDDAPPRKRPIRQKTDTPALEKDVLRGQALS